jgi:hypothetical protein
MGGGALFIFAAYSKKDSNIGFSITESFWQLAK